VFKKEEKMNQQKKTNKTRLLDYPRPPYTKQTWEDIRTAVRIGAVALYDKKGREIRCWPEGETSLGAMATINDYEGRWFAVFLPWGKEMPISAPVVILPPEGARYNR
jgi:hypothetical protein